MANEFLKIRVTDIDWDTEENGEEDDFSLPKEIFIDDHFKMDDYIDEETKELILINYLMMYRITFQTFTAFAMEVFTRRSIREIFLWILRL